MTGNPEVARDPIRPTRSRARRLLQNLLLLGAASTATLLGAELVLRYAAHKILPDGDWVSTASIFRPDEGLGMSLVPGSTRLLVTGGAYTVRDRINSIGLRGPEIREERKSGWRRILVLGDSFVFGQGVPSEEALPAALERRLHRTEVINAGIPGYSLGQEYVLYRDRLRRLQPDLVLLGFFMNDLEEIRVLEVRRDGSGVPIGYTMLPEARLRKERARSGGFLCHVSTWLKGHSLLYTLARKRIDDLRYELCGREEGNPEAAPAPEEAPPYLRVFEAEPSPETLSSWRAAWSTLDALQDLVSEDGARLLVFYVPADWQLSDEAMAGWARFYGRSPDEMDRVEPQSMLRQWASRGGGEFLDLLPALEGHPRAEIYFPYDLHWTPKGHALAADALRDAILASELRRGRQTRGAPGAAPPGPRDPGRERTSPRPHG